MNNYYRYTSQSFRFVLFSYDDNSKLVYGVGVHVTEIKAFEKIYIHLTLAIGVLKRVFQVLLKGILKRNTGKEYLKIQR